MWRILIFLILFSCHPVHAHDQKKQLEIPYNILMEMIGFIEENSEYEYDGSPLPEFYIQSSEEMCLVLFDDPPSPCHIAGYYNDETNTIYVADKPTQHMHQEGYVESIVVHELVHFMQLINGYYDVAPCIQHLEGDAFDIQDLYTDQNDHIHEENLNDPLFSMIARQCPGPGGFSLGGG